MSVDRDTVRRIAHLARIKVTEEEVEKMEGELNAILGFVEQLNEVDVSAVEPMRAVVETTMKSRSDGVTMGGYPDRIIQNAPMRDDHFFLVPKVVE